MLQLKRYRAPTLAAAVLQAKAELGAGAVILEARPVPARGLRGLLGQKVIEVTALAGLPDPFPAAPPAGAPAEAASAGAPAAAGCAPAPSPAGTPDGLAALRQAVQELRARLEAACRQPRPWREYDPAALRALLAPVAPTQVAPGSRRVLALVGPTGSGKTTTAAKLAAHFVHRLGCKVGIVNADSFRVGAWAQMRAQARHLGVPVRECNGPDEAAAVLADMAGCDVVIVDTAGSSFREQPRLEELGRLLAAVGAHEVHLLIPLNVHEGHALAVLQAYGPLGVNRLIFSKADEADGPAVIEAVRACCDLPCSFLTCGQASFDRIVLPAEADLRRAVGV